MATSVTSSNQSLTDNIAFKTIIEPFKIRSVTYFWCIRVTCLLIC
jgi:hypothetical protein